MIGWLHCVNGYIDEMKTQDSLWRLGILSKSNPTSVPIQYKLDELKIESHEPIYPLNSSQVEVILFEAIALKPRCYIYIDYITYLMIIYFDCVYIHYVGGD